MNLSHKIMAFVGIFSDHAIEGYIESIFRWVSLSLSSVFDNDFLKEFWQFLMERKKWWLIPIIVVLLLVGVLLVVGGGSAAAPFVYTLF